MDKKKLLRKVGRARGAETCIREREISLSAGDDGEKRATRAQENQA